jgi:hypothetical protein
MGIFRRRPKPEKHVKKLIVGFIIGAAISSIIGKKMLEKNGVADDDKGEPEDR